MLLAYRFCFRPLIFQTRIARMTRILSVSHRQNFCLNSRTSELLNSLKNYCLHSCLLHSLIIPSSENLLSELLTPSGVFIIRHHLFLRFTYLLFLWFQRVTNGDVEQEAFLLRNAYKLFNTLFVKPSEYARAKSL